VYQVDDDGDGDGDHLVVHRHLPMRIGEMDKVAGLESA
jgi:hypothetical protein